MKQLDLMPEEAETQFGYDRVYPTHEIQDSGYETSDHAGTTSPGTEQTRTPIRAYGSDEAM